jgi:Flp pilus assembly protein TadG
MSTLNRTARKHLPAGGGGGQAMVEFAFTVALLLVLVCASIDFGRALSTMQLIDELTRQGSMLASRGDLLPQAVTAVINGESGLNLADKGEVIITSVTNENGKYLITGQTSSTDTGQTKLSNSSKIGTGVGTDVTGTVPNAADGALQPGQTLFVTEIYYTFAPITPIGNLLQESAVTLPPLLYTAAYF